MTGRCLGETVPYQGMKCWSFDGSLGIQQFQKLGQPRSNPNRRDMKQIPSTADNYLPKEKYLLECCWVLVKTGLTVVT